MYNRDFAQIENAQTERDFKIMTKKIQWKTRENICKQYI